MSKPKKSTDPHGDYQRQLLEQSEAFRKQQLEFIGDRIFSIASIQLVIEQYEPWMRKRFFHWVSSLVTNANLKRPNQSADEVETLCGEILREVGFDAALSFAKRRISESVRWAQFLQWKTTKSLIIEGEKAQVVKQSFPFGDKLTVRQLDAVSLKPKYN